MSSLSIETTFTIVVVITCATSLIGIAALCYVCLSERKRSKQEKEQRLQQRQPQHVLNSTQRNATVTTEQHTNRFSQSLTVPIFTLPDKVGRGSNNKVKDHYTSRSGARREEREDYHTASPMVTLSSSFDDDDVYTNGEDVGASLHDASVQVPHQYPIIRRFFATESTVGGPSNNNHHGNEDEDAASRDMGDDDEDSLDIRTFDDNWSYAMVR